MAEQGRCGVASSLRLQTQSLTLFCGMFQGFKDLPPGPHSFAVVRLRRGSENVCGLGSWRVLERI